MPDAHRRMNRFHLLGNPLVLVPEGGVLLSGTDTLVVADLHLGKSSVLRSRGLPVPAGDVASDLSRLLDLARAHRARELVVAGDLFHGPTGVTAEIEEELARFLEVLEIPFHLVCGNHDAKMPRLPCGLVAVPSLGRSGVRIVHDPADATGGGLHLAGHWHPVAKIPDGKRTSLRIPCFLLRGNALILPAFGSFTGGAVLTLEPHDRFFVPLGENVVELPEGIWRKK